MSDVQPAGPLLLKQRPRIEVQSDATPTSGEFASRLDEERRRSSDGARNAPDAQETAGGAREVRGDAQDPDSPEPAAGAPTGEDEAGASSSSEAGSEPQAGPDDQSAPHSDATPAEGSNTDGGPNEPGPAGNDQQTPVGTDSGPVETNADQATPGSKSPGGNEVVVPPNPQPPGGPVPEGDPELLPRPKRPVPQQGEQIPRIIIDKGPPSPHADGKSPSSGEQASGTGAAPTVFAAGNRPAAPDTPPPANAPQGDQPSGAGAATAPNGNQSFATADEDGSPNHQQGGRSAQTPEQAAPDKPRSAPAQSVTFRVERTEAPAVQMQGQGISDELSGAKAAKPGVNGAPKLSTLPPEDVDGFQAAVTRGLSAALRQRGGTLSMNLTPPTLGRITIKMAIEDGIVNVKMRVHNQTAARMLNSELPTLTGMLESKGLKVEQLSVQLSPQPGAQPHSNSAQNHGFGQQTGEEQDAQHDAGGHQSRGRSDEEGADRREPGAGSGAFGAHEKQSFRLVLDAVA